MQGDTSFIYQTENIVANNGICITRIIGNISFSEGKSNSHLTNSETFRPVQGTPSHIHHVLTEHANIH